MLERIRGGLVVSCQALEDEPLHSPYIMSRMAAAAERGGAAGIRANSREDILAIRGATALPVVGIVKRDYPGSEVFITATRRELEELLTTGCEMIALDATDRPRPGGETLEALVAYCRRRSPGVQLMADVSSLEEAAEAERLGFDCVSATLYGYTPATRGRHLYDDDFGFLRRLVAQCGIPVVAEGNVLTPDMYRRCLAAGAHAVVVGGAITRPQLIVERFLQA
ncbi:N-acetylmannosamine-6-phosphate 2-epimerase [Paenibacillus albicereus]|uniref:Putative N-acetylmannosamine-6-phosphate 2-epimerase n=1 Tax=Paenibacillus albicereus TaxID=2726185 RepID=A0A6H2H3Y9_9BACL|nr:N-acetylmannosamine-6-phosphate 2-epimerase [Paenibacillus albicereus]QJC54382.1 N-acetylmannosamine-6-phosphate 2-epimerase [Paenibacillus albicereus]